MVVVRRTLRVGGRHRPVVVERSAPNSVKEDLHHHVARDHVSGDDLDQERLFQLMPVGAYSALGLGMETPGASHVKFE